LLELLTLHRRIRHRTRVFAPHARQKLTPLGLITAQFDELVARAKQIGVRRRRQPRFMQNVLCVLREPLGAHRGGGKIQIAGEARVRPDVRLPQHAQVQRPRPRGQRL